MQVTDDGSLSGECPWEWKGEGHKTYSRGTVNLIRGERPHLPAASPSTNAHNGFLLWQGLALTGSNRTAMS